jgi:hypothetical protein
MKSDYDVAARKRPGEVVECLQFAVGIDQR